MPAKQIAARPPIAPIARFIWPMAMMTICDMAITQLTATASSRTWMLNGERKEGSNMLMPIEAATMMASGPNQSVRRNARRRGHRSRLPDSREERPSCEVDQHGEQQQQPEPGLHPELADAQYCSKPLVSIADEHGAEEGAEHRDAPAREQRAAEHRPEERRQQPVLSEMAGHRGNGGAGARDHHHRGDRRENAREHVADDEDAPDPHAGELRRSGLGAGREHLPPERRSGGRAPIRPKPTTMLTISSGET